MALTIGEEIYRAFDLASLRKEVRDIEHPQQWNEVVSLSRRCQQARTLEEKLYAERYDTRVEAARRRLIDAAGAKPLEFKPWWAAEDRFSPDDLLRQARREVRLTHERRLGRIDDYERRQLRVIVEEPMYPDRTPPSGRAREPFARAASRDNVIDLHRGRKRDQ